MTSKETNTMSNMIHDDYSERLLDYITDYVRKEGVPPTVDMMIQNVSGKSSKSTVYNRLQKMVDDGLLIQKNIKGYYYPTSIDTQEVSIPKHILERACKELIKNPDNIKLVKIIHKYLT